MRQQGKATAPVILVADDDPAVRRVTARVLTDAGFTVREAMDAREAFAHIRHGISAALVDMLFVNSNGMSGLDIIKHIRDQPHLRTIPVVVLTGFALNAAVVEQARALGGEMWLKPYDPAALVNRLRELLHLGHHAG
jgi:CheY-like chemotaxis protein